jgi:formiminotetrahydrofolate cyclodeaminase
VGIAGFLDEVASAESVPAGGSIAAATVAMAAALLVKAAKLSREHWTEADTDAAATEAAALCKEAAGLVEADADAYRALHAAWRAAKAMDGEAPDELLRQARAAVVDVPLAIVRAGAAVTERAEAVALHCNPRLRGDVLMAAVLAAAAAEGAASLVAINLARNPDDHRVQEARTLAREASGRLSALRT